MSLEQAAGFGTPASTCGGRTLVYDVFDDTYGLLVSGFNPPVQDFVFANDVEFLDEFPFLAPPN